MTSECQGVKTHVSRDPGHSETVLRGHQDHYISWDTFVTSPSFWLWCGHRDVVLPVYTIQPLDRLIALGPLTSSMTSMSRSPYACASHKLSPGALPEAPLFRYSAVSQQHRLHTCGFNVSPRLVSDEGGMTFSYLWQAGSCGLLKSYCIPF